MVSRRLQLPHARFEVVVDIGVAIGGDVGSLVRYRLVGGILLDRGVTVRIRWLGQIVLGEPMDGRRRTDPDVGCVPREESAGVLVGHFRRRGADAADVPEPVVAVGPDEHLPFGDIVAARCVFVRRACRTVDHTWGSSRSR